MTTGKDTAIEPWMEELWTWADKIWLEEELPRDVDSLLSLTELCLVGNVPEIPESIGNLTHLKTLKLSMCRGLKSLPESIGKLVNLEKLTISNSTISDKSIEFWPESFVNLSNLKILSFSGRIVQFPKNMTNLKKLTTLSIDYSSSYNIPNWVFELSQLTSLSLKYCGLTEIPEKIGNLSELVHLDISDNELIKLPESIINLSKLESINLSGNRLYELC